MGRFQPRGKALGLRQRYKADKNVRGGLAAMHFQRRGFVGLDDEVVELMRADPANVERGTRIIIASHYIERIGDRSTNIAEDIVYLVTGDVEDLNP